MILNIDMEDYANTSEYIVETMKGIVPIVPYEVRMVEESYMQFYEEEQRLGKAFNIFTALALFIAAMGLFGMVSFQIAQRAKEISIRKVMGSSVSGSLKLLATCVFRQILIAFLIAAPIAYYFIEQWLQSYVYRTDLNMVTLGSVAFLAMAVAFLSIAFQSFQAATSNPVDSLHSE